jgi:hypothetical protein
LFDITDVGALHHQQGQGELICVGPDCNPGYIRLAINTAVSGVAIKTINSKMGQFSFKNILILRNIFILSSFPYSILLF